MTRLKTLLASIESAEDGVTSIEYALLGALIAVVIITAVAGVGTNLNALFANVATQVGDAITGVL